MIEVNYKDIAWRKYWKNDSERCGFVLKGGEVVEVINIAEEPEDNFEISAEDVARYEDQILASWHTHPRGSANLSQSDYYLFSQVPEWDHIIISKDELTHYYTDKSGQVYRGPTYYGSH
jgi:proteasome lid subunit RPN8/RPN11